MLRQATGSRLVNGRDVLSACLDEMATRLAFCLAVERDRDLQQSLRRAADCDFVNPLCVLPSPSRAWLLLDGDRPIHFVPEVPDGVRQVVVNKLRSDHEVWSVVPAAAARARADERARRILAPIFNAGESPTANQMAKVLKWAPILEMLAYQCFTAVSTLIDGMRGQILTAPLSHRDRDRLLVEYWMILHTMGHLLTIASSPAAQPWLSEMASSFPWSEWTPTFVLARERTLWLTAIAAKSAVAFGGPVLERYFGKLTRADHPLKSFDALLGLVAIGLDTPSLAVLVADEIEAIAGRNEAVQSQYGFLPSMLSSAIDTLRDPDTTRKRFERFARDQEASKVANPKLFGLDALRLDATDRTADGQYLGLIALPSVVQSALGDYYPRQSSSLLIRPREISLILERAWAITPTDESRRTLH